MPAYDTIIPTARNHAHRLISPPKSDRMNGQAFTIGHRQPLSAASDLRDLAVSDERRNEPHRSGNRPEETRDPLNGMVYQCIEGSSLGADHFDLPFVDGEEHLFRVRLQYGLHKNGSHFT